jgi:hypothetical protein
MATLPYVLMRKKASKGLTAAYQRPVPWCVLGCRPCRLRSRLRSPSACLTKLMLVNNIGAEKGPGAKLGKKTGRQVHDPYFLQLQPGVPRLPPGFSTLGPRRCRRTRRVNRQVDGHGPAVVIGLRGDSQFPAAQRPPTEKKSGEAEPTVPDKLSPRPRFRSVATEGFSFAQSA